MMVVMVVVLLMMLRRCYGLVMHRGGFVSGGRVLLLLLDENRCLRSDGRWVWVVVMVVRVLLLVGRRRRRRRHVGVRVPQLTVLADQILHLALELVDALPLRLDEALLVLHDGGELFQVEDGFHGVVQQALHH